MVTCYGVKAWGGSLNLTGAIQVVIDSNVNIYVIGYFNCAVDFDPGPGTDNRTPVGSGDCFLSRFDSGGNFQWVRTWGGSDSDRPSSVGIDANSNIYITGFFQNIVDFDPGAGTDNHTANGGYDCFTIKLDTNGNWQWARTWGGTDNDISYSKD